MDFFKIQTKAMYFFLSGVKITLDNPHMKVSVGKKCTLSFEV